MKRTVLTALFLAAWLQAQVTAARPGQGKANGGTRVQVEKIARGGSGDDPGQIPPDHGPVIFRDGSIKLTHTGWRTASKANTTQVVTIVVPTGLTVGGVTISRPIPSGVPDPVKVTIVVQQLVGRNWVEGGSLVLTRPPGGAAWKLEEGMFQAAKPIGLRSDIVPNKQQHEYEMILDEDLRTRIASVTVEGASPAESKTYKIATGCSAVIIAQAEERFTPPNPCAGRTATKGSTSGPRFAGPGGVQTMDLSGVLSPAH